jgi:hypothetical protein
MLPRRHFQRVFFLLFAAFCILSSRGDRPSPGTFVLDKAGDAYSLEASDSPLSEILRAIDDREPAALRFLDYPDIRVHCRYRDLPLDALLDRLGVNYVLTYTARADGGYRIDDAWLLGQETARLPPGQAAAIRRAIDQLRDDNIRGNAMHACNDLWEHVCEASAFLEEALLSSDYQQRQTAAELLRYCDTYRPSDTFLNVLLERLGAYGFDAEMAHLATPGSAYTYLRDATNDYYRFKSDLIQNLRSNDPQERLFSALILAERGEREFAATLAPILIPHLADNDLPRDGGLAAYALYRLGESVRLYLTPLLDSDDAQQADVARLIIHQLDHPAATDAALEDFFFNTTIRNPVIERTEMYGYWDVDDFPDAEGNYPPAEWEQDWADCIVDRPEPDLSELLRYRVREGDTLSCIARLFVVNSRRLAEVNGLSGPARAPLPAGMILYIPPPEDL